MISVGDLDTLAAARLEDARILLAGNRNDGAVYVCGYAVELALKARICKTLHWANFPQTGKEFEGYASFRTHNLDVLLRLSGQEVNIKQNHFLHWNAVALWNPEARYRAIGSVNPADAHAMVTAAAALLAVL